MNYDVTSIIMEFCDWRTLLACTTTCWEWAKYFRIVEMMIEKAIKFDLKGLKLPPIDHLKGFEQIKIYYNRDYHDWSELFSYTKIKMYGKKYWFWNSILKEELQLWCHYIPSQNISIRNDNYLVKIRRQNFRSRPGSNAISSLLFKLKSLMLRTIPDCTEVKYIGLEGDYVSAYAPVYSDRYYGKREYDSERVKYHIPTVYYDNKRRVKRVSYHAMQCMNINRGDRGKFLLKWEIWPLDRRGKWALRARILKARIFRV